MLLPNPLFLLCSTFLLLPLRLQGILWPHAAGRDELGPRPWQAQHGFMKRQLSWPDQGPLKRPALHVHAYPTQLDSDSRCTVQLVIPIRPNQKAHLLCMKLCVLLQASRRVTGLRAPQIRTSGELSLVTVWAAWRVSIPRPRVGAVLLCPAQERMLQLWGRRAGNRSALIDLCIAMSHEPAHHL